MAPCRATLQRLEAALTAAGDLRSAHLVHQHLDGSDETLAAFLVSNELWGGAGSIADQGGLGDRSRRRAVEAALIDLGEMQLQSGRANPRTAFWTESFKQWRQQGF